MSSLARLDSPDRIGIDAIKPIVHETLGDHVYRDLRAMLIGGQFAPGERLPLRQLATALGTSPMPVRDALRQLMVDQAIELVSARAFGVPVMTRASFVELRDIRIRLEGMAVEVAASRISAEELARLRVLCADFDAECGRDDPDSNRLITLNKELHFTAYRASRMTYLLQIIEGLWTRAGPVLNLDVRRGSERISGRIPCVHHGRLVASLAKGDAAGARDALAADIMSASDHILSQNGLKH